MPRKRPRDLLAEMLWPGVELAVWGDDVLNLDVLEEELAAVRRAIPSRQQEYQRGRSCLRACLDRLAAPRAPILPTATREPQLPDGLVGAITHGADIVAAVAAPSSVAAGIGIDIEAAGIMEQAKIDLILSPREQAQANEAREATARPILVFSAKESIHKAVFPMSRRWFEYLEVEIEFSAGSDGNGAIECGEFGARPANGLPADDRAWLARLQGRYVMTEQVVFTVCRLVQASSVGP